MKILLYSVHDYATIGIRMLGSYLRKHGQEVRLCFLGSELYMSMGFPRCRWTKSLRGRRGRPFSSAYATRATSGI